MLGAWAAGCTLWAWDLIRRRRMVDLWSWPAITSAKPLTRRAAGDSPPPSSTRTRWAECHRSARDVRASERAGSEAAEKVDVVVWRLRAILLLVHPQRLGVGPAQEQPAHRTRQRKADDGGCPKPPRHPADRQRRRLGNFHDAVDREQRHHDDWQVTAHTSDYASWPRVGTIRR